MENKVNFIPCTPVGRVGYAVVAGEQNDMHTTLL